MVNALVLICLANAPSCDEGSALIRYHEVAMSLQQCMLAPQVQLAPDAILGRRRLVVVCSAK